jgi:hypothetical protein
MESRQIKLGHPLHRTWEGMLARCRNPNDPRWKDYGGRGISVCERWRDFWLFAEDMGEKPSPGHSLDRIDNDGDYEPANVRWATAKEQSRNSRRVKPITVLGVTMIVTDWAGVCGCNLHTLYSRLNHVSAEEAICGYAKARQWFKDVHGIDAPVYGPRKRGRKAKPSPVLAKLSGYRP